MKPGWSRRAVLLLAFLGIGSTSLSSAADDRPNVLLIYTDDHAQWAVGAYGNRDVHTPHMDRLAAAGMRFTQGFTKPVCSPSRAMLLTGLYSHRVGIPDYIPHGNPVVSGNGLPPGTPTVASVLKSVGYATAMIGKWHLGYGEKYYPENYGFALAEGYSYIARGKAIDSVGKIPFFVDGNEVPGFRGDPQHTDILADRAIAFLEDQGRQPFFMFLSIYLPHLPWSAVPDEDRAHYQGKNLAVPDLAAFPESTVDETELRNLTRAYYANITCADRNMGRVLDALDRLGMAKNTLVFFIGDNGFNVGQHGLLGKGNAQILRIDDRRPNMFDHSVLVPFIVRWPGVVEAASVNDAIVSTIDVLPTVAEIAAAGGALKTDGWSLLPVLKGESDVGWRDAWFDTYDMIYLKKDHMRMIRTSDWKLVWHFDAAGQPLLDQGHELFNLMADPEELTNRYSSPAASTVKKQLETRLRKWMTEVGVE